MLVLLARAQKMVTTAQDFAALLSQYQQEWVAYTAQVEQQIQLLRTLKHGMELFLLVGSYLVFYLVDCIAEVMAMPLPLVR